ncbi:MAG: hypothetical protein ACR2MX_03175 [Cyclobacteriaceae bacterium]
MRFVDYNTIIKEAWRGYDDALQIETVTDISVRVSTNYVFKVTFSNRPTVFAKLSYFGTYELFKEDHSLINRLSQCLEPPYEDFLARSLTKDDGVYTYHYNDQQLDAWVVFYRQVEIKKMLPKKLEVDQVKVLGQQLARFHLACASCMPDLPAATKTLSTDIDHLQEIINTPTGHYEHRGHHDAIQHQIELFYDQLEKLQYEQFEKQPVFIDWNIGNFSVNEKTEFFSRWDYDWFRICSRVLDFYFFSRVTSESGDQVVFSYEIDTLMGDRFLVFLKEYHQVYPLTKKEILFMKEAYRFFILNYVIKDGRYFFHEVYASRLQKEAYEIYFPSIEERFDPQKILKALSI